MRYENSFPTPVGTPGGKPQRLTGNRLRKNSARVRPNFPQTLLPVGPISGLSVCPCGPECNGTDGEEAWDSADEAVSSDAARGSALSRPVPRARRPDKMQTQTHHIHQLQTIPLADVCQKLLNTAPKRKESTQDASTHTQTASSPVATVLGEC